MVSTRSTKRRSRSPAAKVSEDRPKKVARKHGKQPNKLKLSFKNVKVILLDIEGTICPISWVQETLFPYALKALPNVLATKWSDETFKTYRDAFPDFATASPEAFEAHTRDLTKRDVKIAYLKNLQGYLWEEGYRSHAYSTPVYPDVLTSLDTWASSTANESRVIAIYSSGSIFAQKLLFQHIKDPSEPDDPRAVLDLRDSIEAWFDTTNAGPKNESSSYVKVASELQKKPEEILFLSDNVKEVRAAIEAKLQAVVVDRPGNAPLSDLDRSELGIVKNFEQLEMM
ncbi:enolase-phosphatase E1 [Cladophialophora chaetospira]|uniref:Enolase-phosphatase E1 n=1 Tax=Cladophialophora chaetospira TaxID=386627 RepID=A0AA38X3L0_9EURO|nr:enolase-phosphatase E1 [Cladophialophora chaetospira]